MKGCLYFNDEYWTCFNGTLIEVRKNKFKEFLENLNEEYTCECYSYDYINNDIRYIENDFHYRICGVLVAVHKHFTPILVVR